MILWNFVKKIFADFMKHLKDIVMLFLGYLLGMPFLCCFLYMFCLYTAYNDVQIPGRHVTLSSFNYDLFQMFGEEFNLQWILVWIVYEIVFLLFFFLFMDEYKVRSKTSILMYHLAPFILFVPATHIIVVYVCEIATVFLKNADESSALISSILCVLAAIVPFILLVAYDVLTLVFFCISQEYSDVEMRSNLLRKIADVRNDLEKEKIKSNFYQSYVERVDKNLRYQIFDKTSSFSDDFRFVFELPCADVLKIDKKQNVKFYQYLESFFSLDFENIDEREFYVRFLVVLGKNFEKIIKHKEIGDTFRERYLYDREKMHHLFFSKRYFCLPLNAISVCQTDYCVWKKERLLNDRFFIKKIDCKPFDESWGNIDDFDVECIQVLLYGEKNRFKDKENEEIKDIIIIPSGKLGGLLKNNVFCVHKENECISLLWFYDYETGDPLLSFRRYGVDKKLRMYKDQKRIWDKYKELKEWYKWEDLW